MLKNVTLKIDEALIRRAKEKAQNEHRTLNSVLRQWLIRYVSQDYNYEKLMEQLSYAQSGRSFSREELNEH